MRGFLRAVLAAVSLVCAAPPGHGAERVLRIGYVFPQGSQLGAGASRFAAEVARRTGGAFRIEPYPNSTAGGELEMAEDVRLGHLDMVFITSSSFASLLPDFGIFDIPFLFRDAAHAHAVFDGPIGTTYLARFRQKGLVALAWGENGMRHITNARRPVSAPEDLRGLSLRLPPSEVMIRGFESLGAKAVPLPFPALFGALQSGEVEGQENPVATIVAAQFDRVQRHLTLSGHVYSWAALVMAPATWETLSPAERQVFAEAARLGGQVSREVAGRGEREGVEALRRGGMSVVAHVNRARFAEALEPAFAAYGQRFGVETIQQIKSVQ